MTNQSKVIQRSKAASFLRSARPVLHYQLTTGKDWSIAKSIRSDPDKILWVTSSMARGKILIVDDNPDLLALMKGWLDAAGCQVYASQSCGDALSCAHAEVFDAAILDLKMEEMNGIALLERLLQLQPGLPVIITTAYGTITTAVEAIKKGAYDFFPKSLDAEDLLHRLDKALEIGRLRTELDRLNRLVQTRYRFENIITSSEKMRHILRQVAHIAVTDSTICVYGESGTGKELIAKAIHVNSSRSKGPFIAINCGAIPEKLLENELFGHVKGAFTGADRQKEGLLHQAQKGTLFLDEIAELPLSLQVKLLRVLQEREYYPVGGLQPVKVDFRLVAATNQDLRKAIDQGKFREDLYYRVHVIPVHLPSLRERPEDILLLANHFLQQLSRESNKSVQGISPEAAQRLMLHKWPGNVRELANVIERAFALASPGVISAGHLLLEEERGPESSPEWIPLKEAREQLERSYLTQVLTATHGNISQSSKLADMNRAELYRLLRKYDLTAGSFKGTGVKPLTNMIS